HALALQHGKMVAELRVAGFDKGSAVRQLMADPAMQSAHPVFIGDDLTDMPAMAAVTDLGGCAIVVGEIDCPIARYRFASVAQTLTWMKRECTA
ncbi:trehalose-phosphatase, partial [Blastomonas sp.]|uniref:trehalose-phosphatase n=1 Tax=Blastomonas sp. TaxID=1909299 RepID=UPI0035930BD5